MDCCCSPFCCPSDQNPFLWSHCGTYSGLGILDLRIDKSQAHCPHVATLFSAVIMCSSWSGTMWTVASIGSLRPIQRCLPRRQRHWGTSGSHQRVDAEAKPGLTKQMLMQSLSPAQLLRCPPITTVLDALALYRKDAVAGEIRVKPKPTRGILAV